MGIVDELLACEQRAQTRAAKQQKALVSEGHVYQTITRICYAKRDFITRKAENNDDITV